MLFKERLENPEIYPQDLLDEVGGYIDDLDLFPIPFILLFKECSITKNYIPIKDYLLRTIIMEKDRCADVFSNLTENKANYIQLRNRFEDMDNELVNNSEYIIFIKKRIDRLNKAEEEFAEKLDKIYKFIDEKDYNSEWLEC